MSTTNPYQAIDAYVDAHFDEQVRFLQELVRVPTDTPPGNNTPHAKRTRERPREGSRKNDDPGTGATPTSATILRANATSSLTPNAEASARM